MAEKILLIRLSSIGDIVLCSPVIRSLRNARPDAEIHFLTKKAYAPLLAHNPHIDRLHLFDGDLGANIRDLKAAGITHILDLHRNIRSGRVKQALGVPAKAYPKDRGYIFRKVWLKDKGRQGRHTVERYGETLGLLGLQLDEGGLEFFLETGKAEWAEAFMREKGMENVVAAVIGGKANTKRWPTEKWKALLPLLRRPVLILGGPEDAEISAELAAVPGVQAQVAAGVHGLMDSAALMAQCTQVISHDTGFMHIAAALGLPIVSIWGNTIPEFGFSPYKAKNISLEVKGLSCRPCSKLGAESCPKGHFRCMEEISPEQVMSALQIFKGKNQ